MEASRCRWNGRALRRRDRVSEVWCTEGERETLAGVRILMGLGRVLGLTEKLLTLLLCLSVRVYQCFLSPLQYALRIAFGLQCECRFQPTCSAYALECLKKYHLPTACFLIVKRLLRCQPWCRGGWDPVP